jgi:hypothetical protein
MPRCSSLLQRLCTCPSRHRSWRATTRRSCLCPLHVPLKFPFAKDILCMDSSDCKLPFPVAELQKCLDPRTFDLWQKIIQEEDIADAKLEGLEYCPNCDFAMIFEVGYNEAPLLSCLKRDCQFVSCRRCKKKVYDIPRSLLPVLTRVHRPGTYGSALYGC